MVLMSLALCFIVGCSFKRNLFMVIRPFALQIQDAFRIDGSASGWLRDQLQPEECLQ